MAQICQWFGITRQVEVVIPYPPGITPPVGDAELVPGYEPMRAAVETLTPQLLEAGVQINTARTVLLKEAEIALPDRPDEYFETVVVAPVGPIGRDYANAEEFSQLMQEQGTVIGLLLMETDIPDNPLPAGEYLVFAQRGRGEQGVTEGSVRFINADGETAYAVSLYSVLYEENRLQVPIAAIYQGTKYCVSCGADGWCDCYACSLWQILRGQGANQCPALLNQ
jgi:hypothetical protein